MVAGHPMRVFKWSPEFDPFFESPVAAVWCNLIGLPIHLYEQSALFAIGKLLGNPIQVDQATLNQTRLSFARICVEIDISQTPTEEIIIDILGREVRQKVKWDRIPLYCRDCRHVGHASYSCYANGRRARPEAGTHTTDHNHHRGQGNYEQKHQYGNKRQGGNGNFVYRQKNVERHDRNIHKPTSTSNSFQILSREEGDRGEHEGAPSEVGKAHIPLTLPRKEHMVVDDEGFTAVRNRKGLKAKSALDDSTMDTSTQRKGREDIASASSINEARGSLSPSREKRIIPPDADQGASYMQTERGMWNKPKFYKLMDNGEFDTEQYEEVTDMEEVDPGGLEQELDEDARGNTGGRKALMSSDNAENNAQKKVRFSTSDEHNPLV